MARAGGHQGLKGREISAQGVAAPLRNPALDDKVIDKPCKGGIRISRCALVNGRRIFNPTRSVHRTQHRTCVKIPDIPPETFSSCDARVGFRYIV